MERAARPLTPWKVQKNKMEQSQRRSRKSVRSLASGRFVFEKRWTP